MSVAEEESMPKGTTSIILHQSLIQAVHCCLETALLTLFALENLLHRLWRT